MYALRNSGTHCSTAVLLQVSVINLFIEEENKNSKSYMQLAQGHTGNNEGR